jgi:hypothetical protein
MVTGNEAVRLANGKRQIGLHRSTR